MSWLLPAEPRHFAGLRGLRVAVRSGHVVAFGLILGGVWHEVPEASLALPWALTGASGLALVLLFTYESGVWLLEVRGLAVAAKLLLLAALPHLPAAWGFSTLATLTLAASVVSHMPGRYRHFRPDRWIRERRS